MAIAKADNNTTDNKGFRPPMAATSDKLHGKGIGAPLDELTPASTWEKT